MINATRTKADDVRRTLSLLFLLTLPLILLACSDEAPVQRVDLAPAASTALAHAPGDGPKRPRDSINPRLLRRFMRVANDTADVPSPSADSVALGRLLWFEPRMSNDGTISCNSCHNLATYGVDGRSASLGDRGQLGRRNTPTVYNTSEHFALFWDGRSHSAVQQATMPILDPKEMASTRARVEAFLRSQPGYLERFARAFPGSAEPVSMEHVAESLAAFEQGLQTQSRWDSYLAGDETALSDEEVHGLRVFLDVGCMTCHTGPQVGASSFQRAGAVEAWPNQTDLGRFEITRDPVDKMLFKVPTLMNVARTAPYFHDGSSATLSDAVRRMGRHQLGIVLEEDEVEALVHFLESMTGDLPTDYIAPPVLPGMVAGGG